MHKLRDLMHAHLSCTYFVANAWIFELLSERALLSLCATEDETERSDRMHTDVHHTHRNSPRVFDLFRNRHIFCTNENKLDNNPTISEVWKQDLSSNHLLLRVLQSSISKSLVEEVLAAYLGWVFPSESGRNSEPPWWAASCTFSCTGSSCWW